MGLRGPGTGEMEDISCGVPWVGLGFLERGIVAVLELPSAVIAYNRDYNRRSNSSNKLLRCGNP